jgi:hypothetical protein
LRNSSEKSRTRPPVDEVVVDGNISQGASNYDKDLRPDTAHFDTISDKKARLDEEQSTAVIAA